MYHLKTIVLRMQSTRLQLDGRTGCTANGTKTDALLYGNRRYGTGKRNRHKAVFDKPFLSPCRHNDSAVFYMIFSGSLR